MDQTNTPVTILGCMSGTSLDGLDLCLCSFTKQKNGLSYTIKKSTTVNYPQKLSDKLATAQHLNTIDFLLFSNEYGRFIGNACREFMQNETTNYYIASHGHTIFHQPDKQFTCQIGAGASIAAESRADTICDFRSTDIALQGQGAPLVPVGDILLFSPFDYCLNIGGFANCTQTKTAIAFDICAANYVLNALTQKLGHEFDKDGNIAKSATIKADLLNTLDTLPFYQQNPPKSLGREWVETEIFPTLEKFNYSTEDTIATYTEHIAIQIAKQLKAKTKTLITGGGALNSYLVSRIQEHSPSTISIPSQEIINYKEALIFALLGYLYLSGENNALASVTGATMSSIGGCLYKAPSNLV